MVRSNGGKAPNRIRTLLPMGFESFQLHWWADSGNENIPELASSIREILSISPGLQPVVSSLGLYGNPLRTDIEGDSAKSSIKNLIRYAHLFDCRTLGLFTGRLPGTPWEVSVPEFARVFAEFCREAADNDVRLALENCPMGGNAEKGDWNLAWNSETWGRLFDYFPGAEKVLGLEWEPAHQITQDLDPLGQIEIWSDRIFHVHGKDASPLPGGGYQQTLPGNGITPWAELFRQLKDSGYQGTIDIEGYHDTRWAGDNEIPGQVRSLRYLKSCRDSHKEGAIWEREDSPL